MKMLLGRLSAPRTAEIEEHLDSCSHCLAAVEGLQIDSQIIDLLKEQPRQEIPAVQPDLQKLMTRLAGMHRSNQSQRYPSAMLTGFDDFPPLAPAEHPDELGRLAHFRVLELLGAGGMGVVYRAEDTKLQRKVALKVLRPATARDPHAHDRFLHEARAIASIKHDHVVVVHEVGEAPAGPGDVSTPYLAMELLDGESLQTWMRSNRRPPLAWAVRLGRQVADALAALHARGLIHRDVKPANLWLEPPPGWREDQQVDQVPLGAVARAKLLDFGLAFSAEEALTEGGAPGTPAYMAPEQLRGEPLDGRCDLFGLGCVLYELCTGEHPFPDRHCSLIYTAPFPVCDVNPGAPAELSHLISRLLREDPAARPEAARRVVQELAALQHMLPGVAVDTVQRFDAGTVPDGSPRRPRPRHGSPLAAGGVALAVLAILAC